MNAPGPPGGPGPATPPRQGRLNAHLETLLARIWWPPRPGLLAWLLWPLSVVYAGLYRLQRARQGEPAPLPVPVLVVGNHVVGGAGKTPTVIALVQALQASGHRPGVISRGHGSQGGPPRPVDTHSTAAAVGDEPLLIARRCRVPVWVGRDRRAAALALCAAHGDVDVLVSDDGLQHRALARRAEVVVFDERGAGNGLRLPAGPLREALPRTPPPGCRVLYTAGQPSTPLPGALAQRQVSRAWPLAAWHAGDAGSAQPLSSLRGRVLLAAAGMAAPAKFFDMLEAAGLDILRLPLPDHHPYTALPWPEATPEVVVTEKDAVKLAPAAMGGTRVWVVPLDFRLPEGFVEDLAALLFPSPLRTPHP